MNLNNFGNKDSLKLQRDKEAQKLADAVVKIIMDKDEYPLFSQVLPTSRNLILALKPMSFEVLIVNEEEETMEEI